MNEFVTEAIVLDRKNIGESDVILTLFTQQLGKIKARATSMRKITSKLAGHFQPMTLVLARIIEKNGMRVVDGLSLKKAKSSDAYRLLKITDSISASHQPDQVSWHYLKNVLFSNNAKHTANSTMLLKAFGIEPQNYRCHSAR